MDIQFDIRKKVRALRLEYLLFILFHVLFFLFIVLTSFSPESLSAETLISVRTVTILYSLAMIPLSLKYFAVLVKKIPSGLPSLKKITWYTRWYHLRLIAISTVIIVNECLYLFTHSKSELIMAAIGAVAFLLCIPNIRHIEKELESLIKTDEITPTEQ